MQVCLAFGELPFSQQADLNRPAMLTTKTKESRGQAERRPRRTIDRERRDQDMKLSGGEMGIFGCGGTRSPPVFSCRQNPTLANAE